MWSQVFLQPREPRGGEEGEWRKRRRGEEMEVREEERGGQGKHCAHGSVAHMEMEDTEAG